MADAFKLGNDYPQKGTVISHVTTFVHLSLEPDAPTDIHFDNVTDGSAVVLWYAPRAKISGYRLFLSVEGSNPKQFRLPARLTYYTLLNLRPHTEYSVTLYAEQNHTLSEGETAAFTTSKCLTMLKWTLKKRCICERLQHVLFVCVCRAANGQRS